MDNIVNQLAEQLAESSNTVMEQAVQLAIKKQMASIDLKEIVREIAENLVKANMSNLVFPDGSIPASAVKFSDFTINPDQINPGILSDFSSTGIEDLASDCMLTVMDEFVIVENQLIASSATVKNSLVVEGDLVIKGDINTDSRGVQRLIAQAADKVKTAIGDEMRDMFVQATADKLKSDGLDANKLTINGKLVLDDKGLGKTIVSSNLQKLGVVTELQTRGEVALSDTVYVSNKRVGINTMEPSRALAVWDEECETIMGKYEKNTGYIGSIRNQKVVLGSNNNVNIVLDPDGSTKITSLRLGNLKLNCSDTMPNWTGECGDIVFNESPKLNSPMGWVCLGDARWACLAKITD